MTSLDEKLEAIDQLVDETDFSDYPEHITDPIAEAAEIEHREFLEERLEDEMRDYDWTEDETWQERAQEQYYEWLMENRLTDEEKAELAVDEAQKPLESLRESLSDAHQQLNRDQEELARAAARKPRGYAAAL